MILYFSATGNGKYIAEQIALSTKQECMSIVDCIKEEKYVFIEEKIFGIVVPVYFWRLPRIVSEYLHKLVLQNCEYCFFLADYGSTTGQADTMAGNIMKAHGQKFDSYYSVIMPDTWTPLFNLTDRQRVDTCLRKGNQQLVQVMEKIQRKAKGNFVDKKLPAWIVTIPSMYMYSSERKTSRLHVDTKRCIGCGLCANKCPVEAIQIDSGLPVWKVNECEMCLGCLHRCPKFAISYGHGKSKKHGQYRNPYTKV